MLSGVAKVCYCTKYCNLRIRHDHLCWGNKCRWCSGTLLRWVANGDYMELMENLGSCKPPILQWSGFTSTFFPYMPSVFEFVTDPGDQNVDVLLDVCLWWVLCESIGTYVKGTLWMGLWLLLGVHDLGGGGGWQGHGIQEMQIEVARGSLESICGYVLRCSILVLALNIPGQVQFSFFDIGFAQLNQFLLWIHDPLGFVPLIQCFWILKKACGYISKLWMQTEDRWVCCEGISRGPKWCGQSCSHPILAQISGLWPNILKTSPYSAATVSSASSSH